MKFVINNITDFIHIQKNVISGSRNEEIINNGIEGIHYVDTIEENGMKYLLVHGDDYVPNTRAKSARK